MTTTDGPDRETYNAQSSVQGVLRMPFSSPMGTEILSPTSSNELYNSNRKRRKHTGDHITSGNDPSPSGNLPSPKFQNRQSSRRQEKDYNRIRWPRLNVVTSFSKSSVVNPSGAFANPKHSRRVAPQIQNPRPGFVTISDIKAPMNNKGERGFKAHYRNKSSAGTRRSDLELRSHIEAEETRGLHPARGTEGLGLQPSENLLACDAGAFKRGETQKSNLKPSPTKFTELSPSDRPIVIGISVPSAKLAEHAISPDTEPMPITTATTAISQNIPETPTIIVTPANYRGSWYFPDPTLVSRGRRRPTSSLYSPPIEHGEYTTEDNRTPPLPTPPDRYLRSRLALSANPHENIDNDVVRERPESTCTVFDEDENTIVPAYEERPSSGESRLRILNRSSLDTIATKYRSQGWWNYIVSPFLPRSNATSFAGWAPRAASPVPALPSPSQAELNSHDRQVSNADSVSPHSILSLETA